jgi:enoyl-CoA hydratase/carnithine racemase
MKWEGRVEMDKRDGVATIKIDRPPLNILNSQLIKEAIRSINLLKNDDKCRVLILTGEGDKAFIGGADMGEMKEFNPKTARDFIQLLHTLMKGLRTLPFPVIGRINGYALGAGIEVAMACDLRISAENAIYGLPEVRVGIPSVIEAALMPRLIGFNWSADLLLTGRTIDAREALRRGLIHRVVSKPELDNAVNELVEEIMGCAPDALRAQKELIYGWMNSFLEDSIKMGIEAFSRAYQGNEPKEGMSAFFEKRPPAWKISGKKL